MKFEQLINLKLNNFNINYVKEGFPIPSPGGTENESEYIARCNRELADEFPEVEQRNAVCYSKWKDK